MKHCLLCASTETEVIGSVDTDGLIKRYRNLFKADFSYLFTTSVIKLVRCNSCDLKFYDPIVAGDENFYSVLQKADHYYRDSKEEYNLAAHIVTPSSSVLDVGCGKGEFRKFIPTSNFTGLEFSKEAIKSGGENGTSILNQSVEEHAQLHSKKYDFVTAFQVLEHVTDLPSFIKSCADCVKPGGKLIIAVPSEESYLQFSTNSILNMPPHHISRWTDKALQHLIKLIDFDSVEIFHDSLDPLHVTSFFSVLLERSLPFSNRNKVKLLDNSLRYKIRMKIAGILAKRMSRHSSHVAWHGKGQNVTAVFKKREII
ncbi:MAG: methyltransferase domain-containing protein [Chitinophagaceae bacterium]